MRSLKFVVVKQFEDFLPELVDFEIVEEQIAEVKDGEFLVKAEYISVDPYMRSFAHEYRIPYEQFGFQVGKVVESKNPDYPVNMTVVSHSSWREYALLNGSGDEIFGVKPYDPQVGTLPLSLALGALGMPGMTAYLGLLHICKPKPGETVCVTSAGGAVGSLVGQIAKLSGCTVIAFTGSDAKVNLLLQELGFHSAYNYKTTEIKKVIQPASIDCFFDTVGGELSEEIMKYMKEDGRVAVCGSISTYGQTCSHKKHKPPKSMKVVQFSFSQWSWVEQQTALKHMKEWVQDGTIIAKETIANGFEKLPETFIAMLKGETVGKAVVKV